MNGFLLVNKPEGITSYDVIRKLKTFLPKKTKIGHSGTLDPFATGLLIVAIGRDYTRQLNTLLNLDKTYQAEITFGKETDSYDIDGIVTYTHPDPIALTENDVSPIIEKFNHKKFLISGLPSFYVSRGIKRGAIKLTGLSLSN